jgi:hypothetical protein
LPVLIFERAYSMHFLAQFGTEYDVFAPFETPAEGGVPLSTA